MKLISVLYLASAIVPTLGFRSAWPDCGLTSASTSSSNSSPATLTAGWLAAVYEAGEDALMAPCGRFFGAAIWNTPSEDIADRMHLLASPAHCREFFPYVCGGGRECPSILSTPGFYSIRWHEVPVAQFAVRIGTSLRSRWSCETYATFVEGVSITKEVCVIRTQIIEQFGETEDCPAQIANEVPPLQRACIRAKNSSSGEELYHIRFKYDFLADSFLLLKTPVRDSLDNVTLGAGHTAHNSGLVASQRWQMTPKGENRKSTSEETVDQLVGWPADKTQQNQCVDTKEAPHSMVFTGPFLLDRINQLIALP